MLGISFSEFLIIGVVALLVLGPDKLPTLLKTVGKALREFRRATRELRDQLDVEGTLREAMGESPVRPKPVKRVVPPSRIYPPEGVDSEDVEEESSDYPPETPYSNDSGADEALPLLTRPGARPEDQAHDADETPPLTPSTTAPGGALIGSSTSAPVPAAPAPRVVQPPAVAEPPAPPPATNTASPVEPPQATPAVEVSKRPAAAPVAGAAPAPGPTRTSVSPSSPAAPEDLDSGWGDEATEPSTTGTWSGASLAPRIRPSQPPPPAVTRASGPTLASAINAALTEVTAPATQPVAAEPPPAAPPPAAQPDERRGIHSPVASGGSGGGGRPPR